MAIAARVRSTSALRLLRRFDGSVSISSHRALLCPNFTVSQVYAGQTLTQPEHATQIRLFAKNPPSKGDGAAKNPPPRASKGDDILKGIFLEVKNKFETAMSILRKEKIIIDPEDPAAVQQYANVMRTVREKAGLFSESEKIKYTIETRTHGIPDARTYLLTLQEIRTKSGLTDDLGAEAMMFEALDKVEKELKQPLMRNDKKGMSLLMAEFDKVNKKLGIRKEDLPKLEKELELKIAKCDLEVLKKEAFEAMDTQKKREEFKDEDMPEVKSLDIRNFL